MGRPSNQVERRAQIVEAAVAVMAKRGFAGASVAAIAAEAGLTAGLVHYHFASKEAVLLALITHLEASVDRREAHFLEALGDRRRDPRELLGARLDAYLARGPLADPDAVACWVAIGAEALARPDVAHAYREVATRAVARLAALLEPLGAKEAKRDAAVLFSTIEGLFRLAAIAPELIVEGSAADASRAVAAGLLGAGS